MSARGIEARLHKIERVMGVDHPDEFSFLERLSDDDLHRLIHDLRSRIASNEGGSFTPQQIAQASAKVAEQEREVLAHIRWEQRPDVAAAIASNIAAGRGPQPWDWDWEGLANDWGMIFGLKGMEA